MIMWKHLKKSACIKKTRGVSAKATMSHNQILLLLLLIFGGTICSLLLFVFITASEDKKMRTNFEQTAKVRISMFKDILEENLHALNWLGNLYKSSEKIGRSEFREFVWPYLQTHPEVQALEWVPRVLDSERQAYEAAAKEDGFADFQIIERQSNGTMVPAFKRKEYFPVCFVEPYEDNVATMGFDLGSNPIWFETLKWSYENNQLAATERIVLIRETNSRESLLICKPIYHSGSIIDSLESRRDNLKGFVVLALRIDLLLEKLIAHFEPWDMSTHLYDISSPADKYLLGEYFPFVRSKTDNGLVSYEPYKAILQTTDLYSSGVLDVANKKWEIICAPAPFFIVREKTVSPWIAMISGFGFTGVLSLLTLIVFKRIAENRQAEREKRQLQAQLRQTQKMEAIGTLAGGIAHDFNNILAALIGYADLAMDDIPEGTVTHQNIEGVLIAANRATELIKQILTFSRKDEARLICVNINTIVAEALKLLRSSLPRTIEIDQNINCNSTIMADETQIHQILVNLCTNAAHAMSETGGVLEVNLTDINIDSNIITGYGNLKQGLYVKLTVKDTGCGMGSEVKERIFEPFYTTKEIGKGTGLGLSVIHGIVENHNGIITVDSNPGEGTTFNIFFPCTESVEIIKTEDSHAALAATGIS
jgi:signal transduction histidine kinase